jgi:hypothetical protein
MKGPWSLLPKLLLVIAPGLLPGAPQTPSLEEIVARLDRLEKENAVLRQEVQSLKSRLAPAESVEERLEVQERRTEEMSQTKVEASQRFPVRLTGMAVFNTYYNSRLNGGNDNPAIASLTPGNNRGGGTFRQSVVGLLFDGPQTIWNGKVSGSLYTDFAGGGNTPLSLTPRIRTGTISLDWGRRAFTIGQEKPVFSPRDPKSLAQIALSPMTGAGNLWLWVPQARYEERVKLGEGAQLRAELGLVQTSETGAQVPPAFANSVERFRPGLEGRFEFSQDIGRARIEVAPGFHRSSTHVAATSVPSDVFSVDWLIAPVPSIEWTGFFFNGKNVAKFGTGGIRQGFNVDGLGQASAIHSQGGWTQLRWQALPKLDFHFMAGQHDDRNSDLRPGGIGRNQAIGGNFFYRIAPNVIFSFEAMQVRTNYLGVGNRLNNHYDLSVAYLF